MSVVGNDGQPVPDVVVFVKQMGLAINASRKPKSAVMDQRDMRFQPHILIVEKGARVKFPNSDVIAHHVYSFSRPNDFVLPLYKGTPPGRIAMEYAGVVTLGCNIHDSMLGYIVVVDTATFGMTNTDGRASVSVSSDANAYEVSIWSPRIRDSRDPLVQNLFAVSEDDVVFKLQKTLHAAHVDQLDDLEWDDY